LVFIPFLHRSQRIRVFQARTVHDFSFTPDGAELLSREGSELLRWHFENQTELPTYALDRGQAEVPLPRSPRYTACWTIHPNGKEIATIRSELTLQGGRLVLQVTTFPEGTLVFTQALWAVPLDRLNPSPDDNWVHRVAYSPCGTHLVGVRPSDLFVWNSTEWIDRGILAPPNVRKPTEPCIGTIRCHAFTPDGTRLAVGCHDGRIQFWNMATWQPDVAYQWGLGPVHALTFSPDGTLGICATGNKVVVWDLDD
jgi:WD40 repeat protein